MTQEGKIDTGAGEARRVPWLDIVGLAVIGLVLVVFFRVIGMYLAIGMNALWWAMRRPSKVFGWRVAYSFVALAFAAPLVVAAALLPFRDAVLHSGSVLALVDLAVVKTPYERVLLAQLGLSDKPCGSAAKLFSSNVWELRFFGYALPPLLVGFWCGLAVVVVTLPMLLVSRWRQNPKHDNKTLRAASLSAVAWAWFPLIALPGIALSRCELAIPGGLRAADAFAPLVPSFSLSILAFLASTAILRLNSNKRTASH